MSDDSQEIREAEKIAAEARETLNAAGLGGDPSLSGRIAHQHRRLTFALERLLEYHQGYAHQHERLVKLVKMLLDRSSTVTTGLKFWKQKLPTELKTALVLLNTFLRDRKKK